MTGEREIRRDCREPRAARWVRRRSRGRRDRNANARGDGGCPPGKGGGSRQRSRKETAIMLIAAKVLGATFLAGALTASGVLTTENLTGNHETAAPVTTPVPDPHATFRDLAVGGNADVSAGDAGTATVP